MAKQQQPTEHLGTTPDWPTMIRSRLSDGRLLGVDNSLWLYRSVPMAPVAEARTPEEGVATAEPLMMALEEVAAMAASRPGGRRTSRASYRDVHLLLVNLPQRYVPPADHPIADYLATSFPDTVTDRRVLLLGVRLQAKVGGEGGLRRAIDSVAETLAMGGTPLSDYDPDYRDVAAAMTRAGLTTPSHDDLRLASAWWNEGGAPDVPMLSQANCLHVFTSMEAAKAAKRAGADSDLTHLGAGHHTITFASVSDLDLPFVSPTDLRAQWATQLVEMGALAISVRGKVEPTVVTRAELRKNRKRYQDDINERVAAGKMERAEQSEHEALLADVEGVYAQGGPPTLVESSIVVGFNGLVPDMADLSRGASAQLLPMTYRQRSAMAETMLCSPVRANPHLQDLPTQSVACSGLPSLSTVGDRTGAQLGFTESDRQPAFMDPMSAAHADSLPMGLVAGQTGAGKQTALSTIVPTPSGSTTIGALKVGDEVFGRDGRPCRVTALSPVDETPELYRVVFSDGQVVLADANHQWVVSSFWDRNGVRHPSRVAATAVFERAMVTAEELDALAAQFGPDDELTLDGLLTLVRERVSHCPWRAKSGVLAALRMVDAPYTLRVVQRPVTRTARELVKVDPVVVYPVAQVALAAAEKWAGLTGGNASRWAHLAGPRAAAARAVAAAAGAGESQTLPEIARRIAELSGVAAPDRATMQSIAVGAGVAGTRERRQVVVPVPAANVTHQPLAHYPAAVALKSLAMRVRQQYADAPVLEAGEVVMSTAEILDAGVRRPGGGTRFAVRVARALDLPAADLPVPAYTLGAWLGDGSSNGGGFTGIDPEIIADIVNDGFEVTHSPTLAKAHHIKGLVGPLRAAGVLNDKHIPAAYLRASREQRLAVLQGLMDTDGTISRSGGCELALCHERLATDALELIRSLGIKATMTTGDAAITEADPDNPGQTRRRVTGTRYRVKFTTDQPVFRLPRKAARLPQQLRESHQWLYIESIEATDPVPARCLTVDSPDSTYLVEGFIPTHNTMGMLWLADQYARLGTPTIIIDPKALTLDTPIATPSGWVTMGDIQVGDTVFGRDGRPCNVVHKSRIFTETNLYEFYLDDGQVVRADEHHQWVVASQTDRAKLSADPAGAHWRELTTEQIIAEGVKRGGQSNFALPLPEPVDYDKADLAIPPYVLGAWLGDGVSKSGEIVAGFGDAAEMTELISAHWPQVKVRDGRTCRVITCSRNQSLCKRGHDEYAERTRTATGETYLYCRRCNNPVGHMDALVNPSLQNLLVDEGLLGDKHIPATYLRGSVEQRMDLLRGLMDTDGTVKRSGACRYSSTNRRLAEGVLELVRSLGIKATIHTSVAAITEPDPSAATGRRRRAVGEVHDVTFRTHLPVFSLRRKLMLLPAETPKRARFVYVKDVVPVASEPAQCIRVDSSDHTYLVAGYVVTHNTGSDHTEAVMATGRAQVASLDELASADGIFDPIRFSAKPEVGVELAASMLMSINPWGSKKDDFETPLQYALHYGVSRGATCVGQALWVAKEEGHAPAEMVDAAFRLASSSPMFRAIFGINPSTEGLRVAGGITLIKVGDAHLDLPAPGSTTVASLPQRIALALVRMMVFGSAMALTGRDGVVMLDEAWVFLSAGREEMERLGRLARSQRVFPLMFTQRVSDAVNAGLAGYISRGLIGPIQDRGEAIAACELFKLAPTEERLARITASETIGSGSSTAPNWNSMRALIDPGSRQVHRGSVWIYCDIQNRAVPVEVVIPPSFLARASTNAAEVRQRAAHAPAPVADAPYTVQASPVAAPVPTPAPGFQVATGPLPAVPSQFSSPVVFGQPAAPQTPPVGVPAEPWS